VNEKKITEYVELQPFPQIFKGFPPVLEVKLCQVTVVSVLNLGHSFE